MLLIEREKSGSKNLEVLTLAEIVTYLDDVQVQNTKQKEQLPFEVCLLKHMKKLWSLIHSNIKRIQSFILFI